VLLQEVDTYCGRSGRRDVARDLAEALDMNWVGAGEFQEIGEGAPGRPALTGQAILSRFPIEDAAALPFASQARWRWTLNPVQPRRGGRMTLRARTGGLLIYNTHFESGKDENLRARQIDEITRDASRHPDASTLVAGDLNNASVIVSPIFRSLADASFEDLLDNVGSRGPTSYGQTHPIDWMFGRNVASGGGRIVSVIEPASDHFPVVAAISAPAAVASVAAAVGSVSPVSAVSSLQ
jgi:endonuclease/exonuclease/phosphatase family metal-dependent hydrolase